jgi:hypothetical protein
VKKITDKAYQCEKCGTTYLTAEHAAQCESNPISPFKYKVGEIVLIELKPKMPRTKHAMAVGGGSVLRSVVKERWVSGLSEKDKTAHKNMYKLHIIERYEGIVACRSEDEIFGKA